MSLPTTIWRVHPVGSQGRLPYGFTATRTFTRRGDAESLIKRMSLHGVNARLFETTKLAWRDTGFEPSEDTPHYGGE